MKTKNKFYITTAIDYVNAEPHIGHAYQKIVADVLARWNLLQGKDIFFLTGTDEHGKKIAQSAEKAGSSPEKFVDKMAEKFKEAWKELDIEYDRFIRTTDADHKKIVEEFTKDCDKAGDIYKGKYKGYYCTSCEAYYTEKEYPNLICPIHQTNLEKIEEETYFFKLSKYRKFLLDLYKENPEFILPETKRNEIINRVKEGLQDLSITRTSFSWGIPFPLDKNHIFYVWWEALINYYTATKQKGKEKFWPADIHLLGKDNGWFHAVIWPAMLKSAGIDMPKKIFIHGFLTFNGQKISKSLGNVISPTALVKKYGADTVRYFSLRQFPFGEDGDFSEKALIDRHNNELADKLGNLVSRVSALAEKYGLGKVEQQAKELESKNLLKKVSENFENFEFDKALNEIFLYIDKCNTYIQDSAPWTTKDNKVLYRLANAIKDIAILLSPFMPKTSEKIAETFKFKIDLKELNKPIKMSRIKKSEILFNKISNDQLTNKPSPASDNQRSVNNLKSDNNKQIEGIINMNQIKYSDFEKLDMRVGVIKKVEDVEDADKLLKLEVEIGKEHITILAGIKQHYKKSDLENKQVIIIANLEPRKMKGLVSEGMLLAAVSEDESKIVIISPEKKIESGSKIR